MLISRSPHGERGLKLCNNNSLTGQALSLPARGAWIEIRSIAISNDDRLSRSPHGERGLKLKDAGYNMPNVSRSPHGERGLKYQM